MGGKKLRVVVLFGGRSGEHEISLMSAESVISSLDRGRYEVVPVGITKEGRWIAGLAPAELGGGGGKEGGVPVAILPDPSRKGLFRLDRGPAEPYLDGIDVVFPVLHGTYGEDGTLQGLLELANVPYVGAGVLASSLGMDKVFMKTAFAQAGLPQARFWSFLRGEWERRPGQIVAEIERRFGYPCFVKPANLGSSVGISKARNRQGLEEAVALAVRYDRKVIVEEFVWAREVEVSVLGNEEPVASLPGEIVPRREFYDYEAKYVDGNAELIVPAQLPPDVVDVLQDYAVRAFRAVDCAGMARVDFFLTRDEGRVLVNEINTIPGFTPFSMYPKLWEVSGLSYPQLLDRLIELALERHREKNRTLYGR